MTLQTTRRRVRYLTTDDVLVIPTGRCFRVTDISTPYAGAISRVTLRATDGTHIVERFHTDALVEVAL